MEKKVALIFGASGQDGFYLNNLLLQKGLTCIKTSRKDEHLPGDVSNFDFVKSLIIQYQPQFIFHFAANSTTRHNVLFENHEAISTGTFNILECVRLYCPGAKIFLSGSAMQFQNTGLPINEQTPFEASSPYSVSRIHSVYAGRYYRKAFGMQVYVGYFFNHDSPLRTEHHVNQKIASAAKRIAKGSNEKLVLGNVEVKKEFNYAGDVVEAVWTLVNQGNTYEAVIGSGHAYTIKDWVIGCFEKINVNWKDVVTFQQDFVPEYQVLVSDPALIMSLGWQPRVNFFQLVNMMMNEA